MAVENEDGRQRVTLRRLPYPQSVAIVGLSETSFFVNPRYEIPPVGVITPERHGQFRAAAANGDRHA